MLICIMGPDGTGKTTLAKKLSEELDDLEYIYFGGNKDQREFIWFNEYIKQDRKGWLWTLFKYFFIFINDYVYFIQAKNKHIVADRSPIDKMIGSKINGKAFRYIYHLVALKLLPSPDLIILLEGDVDVIYERKREISRETILEYFRLYKSYFIKTGVPYFIIDSTVNDINQVAHLAKQKIENMIYAQ